MKYKVLWSSTTKRDLNEIIDFIANDEIEIAKKQYSRIKDSTENKKYFLSRGESFKNF